MGRRDLVEMSFGRTSFLKHVSNETKRMARGLTSGKADSIDEAYLRAVGAKSDDPQLDEIYDRWQQLDETYRKIMDGEIEDFSRAEADAVLAAKDDLEARIRRAEPTLMNSVYRGARALQHIVMGRKRGHFGEAEIFSRQLYGQAIDAERRGDLKSAMESMKLAITFEPKNDFFKAKLKELSKALRRSASSL